MWEYPFVFAGVNITFMLIQMLDLEAGYFTSPFSFLVSVYFMYKRMNGGCLYVWGHLFPHSGLVICQVRRALLPNNP